MTFTVTLSAEAEDEVTATWTASIETGDSAESGDFTAVAATALTFTAGQTAKTLTVATTEDTTDEEDETFTVTLSNPSSNAALATGATAKGTIEDDDDPPSVGIGRSAGSEAGGELIPTLELSAASEKTVTVTWTASIGSGDTAVAADFEDLSAATGTAEIAPGTESASLRTLHPHVFDDALDEPDETFTVTLSNPVNATLGSDPTATMTIEDDDPTPTVTVADAAASEGGNVAFVVALSAVSGRDVEVDYATSEASPQSAVSGTDFTAASGTLTIEAGEETGTIEVAATEDDDEENDETFTLTISNPKNATLTTDTTATGTINDGTLPRLSVADAAATEGSPVTFAVTLSTEAEDEVTAAWTASIESDDTAVLGDLGPTTAGTVTVPMGSEAATITVATVPDDTVEGDETFTVTLSGVSASAVLGTASATAKGTIENDDLVTLSVADVSAAEGDTTDEDEFTTKAAPEDVTVTLSIESGRRTPDGRQDRNGHHGRAGTRPRGRTPSDEPDDLHGDAVDPGPGEPRWRRTDGRGQDRRTTHRATRRASSRGDARSAESEQAGDGEPGRGRDGRKTADFGSSSDLTATSGGRTVQGTVPATRMLRPSRSVRRINASSGETATHDNGDPTDGDGPPTAERDLHALGDAVGRRRRAPNVGHGTRRADHRGGRDADDRERARKRMPITRRRPGEPADGTPRREPEPRR